MENRKFDIKPGKKVDYEDFETAIKAAYQLGKLDGENEKQIKVEQMQLKMRKLLISNKALWNILSEEHKTEANYIPISPTTIANILDKLRESKCWNYYNSLKQRVERITGKKYVIENKGVNAGKKGRLVGG